MTAFCGSPCDGQTNSASLLAAAVSFHANAGLIWQLTKRELTGRYGSYLGIVWAPIHPLLMLAAYTFVFSVVSRRDGRWAR